MPDVPAELGEQERSTFFTTALVPDWVFNLNLVKYCAIFQLDEQRISNRAFFRVVIVDAEPFILDAVNLSTECVYAWVSSRLVRAAKTSQLVSGWRAT